MSSILRKLVLIGMVVFIGSGLGGCTNMIVDKAAERIEDRLDTIKDEKYVEVESYLKTNGGKIEDVDLDMNGVIEPKELVNAAIKNPTAAWWWSEEFWLQIGGLLAATFGWRGVRSYRRKKNSQNS